MTQWRQFYYFTTALSLLPLVSTEWENDFHSVRSTPGFSISPLSGDNTTTMLLTSRQISGVPNLPSMCKVRYGYDRRSLSTLEVNMRDGLQLVHLEKVASRTGSSKPRPSTRGRVRRLGSHVRRIVASSSVVLQLLKLFTKTIPFVGIMFSVLSKMVLPLYFARRLYRWITTFSQDWYTGFYLRTTFERMYTQYRTLYRVPECSRSIGRLVLHLISLFVLGRVMEELIGLSHAPCTTEKYVGCKFWCGCLWMVAVVGAGHAAGVALAVWGGYLRIQVEDFPQRPSGRRIITRPWVLFRWVLDPDQWFREIIARDRHSLKPFNPDVMMFPSTWPVLRIMFLLAIAVEMSSSNMHKLMRNILVHQALSDEWYRVVMCEKRVAWGIVVGVWVSIRKAV